MSKRNARARQLSNARKIQAEKRSNAPRLQLLTTITACLESMSFGNLQELQNKLDNDNPENKSLIEKTREKLIEDVGDLPVDQVKSAYYLFQNMRYPKGKNQGEIFSIYIQKKAIEFLKSELYKHSETKEY